jgi:hypothetical protein
MYCRAPIPQGIRKPRPTGYTPAQPGVEISLRKVASSTSTRLTDMAGVMFQTPRKRPSTSPIMPLWPMPADLAGISTSLTGCRDFASNISTTSVRSP